MALAYPEIRSFAGLHLQANSFTVPDGALERGHNVVISKDNIISKTRGFYLYYDPSTDTLNQTAVFQSKLMGIFTDKIGYFTDTGSDPNYTGTRTTLSGATVKISGTRVSRYAQSNKNFYFTTDKGILKLENYNGTIYNSGTPPALDLRARFTAANGPVSGEKQCGWRYVIGKKDANGNEIIGAPSEVMTLTNSKVDNVVWSRTSNVVTVTSTSHGLATGMSITVSDAASDTHPISDGSYTITVTGTNTFTFSSTGTDDSSSQTLDYTVTRSTRLEGTVPSEITSTDQGYFYRIYRSSQVADTADAIFSDFRLIDQKTFTSAEITARIFFYDDDIDDILLADELYTNENSQEGEASANLRPPLSQDIALFKGFLVYGNIDLRHYLDFQIVDPSVLAATDYVQTMTVIDTAATYTSTGAGPYTVTVTSQAHGLTTGNSIFVSNSTDADADGTFTVTVLTANTFTYSTSSGNPNSGTLQFGLVRRYVAQTGVGNATVKTTSVTSTGGKIEATYSSHGFANGDTIYVSNVTGTLAAGTYYIVNKAANTFQLALTAGGTAIAWTDETAFDFEGVTNGTYPIFKLDASSSASVQLRDTGRGLVRAINRDPLSLIYAAYTSGIDDVPGKIRLSAKAFTGAIYLMGNDSTTGSAFSPVIPSAFSTGTQVYSSGADLPHVTAFAKYEEPEGVPLYSRLGHGAQNKEILRIAALRDSLIVIKEDGVFRMTGDDPSNFTSTVLDSTVVCVAPDTVAVLNNEVLFLSNQGLCRVTETSINIISRKIEDPIQPILGSTVLSAQSSAVGYESERLYALTTIEYGDETASITWLYNILNDTFTTSEFLGKRAVVGPNDVLYQVDPTTGYLMKERKNQNRLDWCGQNYTATVDAVASDLMSATVTFGAGAVPQAGDVIVHETIFNRIIEAAPIVGQQYEVTFLRATNLEASDAATYYATYTATIKFAPFHAGLVGRMKVFVEMQLHFRNESFGAGNVYFSGDTFGSSENTEWNSLLIPRGWGRDPYGLFPWGNEDSTAIVRTTQPGPICRIEVPRYQKRGTFIQATIVNTRAGDPINLQAVTWVVRSYNERVTT